MARDVGDGEEEVADLFADALVLGLRRSGGFLFTRGSRARLLVLAYRGAQLVNLFAELVEDVFDRFPVEADARGLRRELVRLHQRGHFRRDAVEERRVVRFIFARGALLLG